MKRILRSLSLRGSALLCLFAVATTAAAQLTGEVIPRHRTLPVTEEVRRQLQTSRWHLGRLRVQPSLGLRDFGYDNNVYGSATDRVGDWRSTASASGAFILPVGPKTYLRGGVAPSYTYYRKLANRRSFGGDYSAALLGLFNRLSVEAGAAAFRGTAPVSSELDRAALSRRTAANGSVEIEILRRLSIFGAVHEEHQRYIDTADDLARGLSLQGLERNENASRGGIRYRFSSYLDFSLGAEATRTNFLVDRTKDNRSHAGVLGVHYDRPRAFLNMSIGRRTGEAVAASSRFTRFSTTTGSYYAAYKLASRSEVDAYGQRGLGYSLTVENPYYIETLNGAGLTIPLGHRIAVRGFSEWGTNSYPNLVQGTKRVDDITRYGGGFVTQLTKRTAFTTLASWDRINGHALAPDRTVFRVTTLLTLGGDLFQ